MAHSRECNLAVSAAISIPFLGHIPHFCAPTPSFMSWCLTGHISSLDILHEPLLHFYIYIYEWPASYANSSSNISFIDYTHLSV